MSGMNKSIAKAVIPSKKNSAPSLESPPVYRPEKSQSSVQRKPAPLTRAGMAYQPGTAPPVYRPQPILRALQPKPGQLCSPDGVVQRAAAVVARAVGDPVAAGTTINIGQHMTNHGHTVAEIRAQLQAQWASRTLRANGSYSVSWGAGAPSGIIFWDNGGALTITHAQSGANIAAQQAAQAAANAARAEAGGGPESSNWRR